MATNHLLASEIQSGDNLFGAGLVTSVVPVPGGIEVTANGNPITLDPDEEVTVDRA